MFAAADSTAFVSEYAPDMTCNEVLQEMLQAGLIVAGWDPVDGGSVYAVPLGGTLVQCPFAIGQTITLHIVLPASCSVNKLHIAA